MDDAKLANGPVKVRCAKCKEVFVVRPEAPPAESVAPPLEQAAPPADKPAAAEFSFDAPADTNKFSAPTADEFSFDDEPPAASQTAATGQPDSSGEFDWQTTKMPESDASEADSRFDLSAFDASLSVPAAPPAAAAALADDNEFDFGEVDFSAQNRPPEESSVVADSSAAGDFSLDFGEVSFSDQAASGGGAESPSEEPTRDVDALSGQRATAAEPASADDFLLSFAADTTKPKPSAAHDMQTADKVISPDFSFAGTEGSAETASAVAGADIQAQEQDVFVAFGSSEEGLDEELPPASLTSRKKSGSLFPVLVIIGAILLIIALAGGGVYFSGGSKAFSKVGLGFLVDWYGNKGAEKGSIVLQGVTASYLVNSTADELFVVRGEAVNNYSKPRASIQVKVSLLGPGGTNLVTKSAYCGNSLSNEQLTTLPLAKIEEIMGNQFGDSLANLGLKPGGTIPFVVVVSPLPKDASDYSVVVGGSTVATQ
jgi:hypothetical protein